MAALGAGVAGSIPAIRTSDMKICQTCNETKPLTEFHKNARLKDGYQRYCISCRAKIDRKHYLKTRESHKDIRNSRRADSQRRNREYVRAYLLEHPCVDCGNTDLRVLEFDHLRDKKKDVTILIVEAASLARLKEEIEKCEVRCANCHAIVTLERSGQGTWRSIDYV